MKISTKLKEERIKAGFSVEQIAKQLNIRKQYLIDLENENYDAIPGKAYVKGYTKLYLNFLGLKYHEQEKNIRTKNINKKKYKASTKIDNYTTFFSCIMLVLIYFIYGYYI